MPSKHFKEITGENCMNKGLQSQIRGQPTEEGGTGRKQVERAPSLKWLRNNVLGCPGSY